MKKQKWTVGKITRIGVLGALSAILYIFPEIPVIPPIYKLDFSTMPALLAGFAMGPSAAVYVTAIKDLTGLLHSSSMGVGEVADFIMSGSFAVVASIIYARGKNTKSAVVGMIVGTIVMALVGAITNLKIMIPAYAKWMETPVEAVIAWIAETIPAVDSLGKLILFAVVPFNLLKGVVLSIVGGLIYRYVKPLLLGKKG